MESFFYGLCILAVGMLIGAVIATHSMYNELQIEKEIIAKELDINEVAEIIRAALVVHGQWPITDLESGKVVSWIKKSAASVLVENSFNLDTLSMEIAQAIFDDITEEKE